MKLKFVLPVKKDPVYKASIHMTGRLGFNIETAEYFNISTDKSMMLAIDEDIKDGVFYGRILEANNPDGYKIQKAGKYHSVNAKYFFDTVEVNYNKKRSNQQIIVTEVVINDEQGLKFTPVKKVEINNVKPKK